MKNTTHPHTKNNRKVAAIDVGSQKLHVAVLPTPVRVYETFTQDLLRLARDLQVAQVTTVALEATGVYWLPLYDVLEAAGLEVCVVNGAHVKNVPGRKTDMADCQWLAHLHRLGLLRGGFVPPADVRKLRDFHRLRQDHIRMGAQHVQHMQQALERMNLKIHHVLSRLTGFSGLRLVTAILQGERQPEVLLQLCDVQVIQRKRQALLKALEGQYRPEHLFALRQAYEGWSFYQQQMRQCDLQMQAVLETLAARQPAPAPEPNPLAPSRRRRQVPRHNACHIPQLGQTLQHIHGGCDLTRLPCLTEYSVVQLVAEVGTDMTRWPTAKHFTAWLGLSPGSHSSGKKRRSQRPFIGAAGRIFAMAVESVARSKYLALGGFYRRLKAKRGPQVANIATARKLAVLYYHTLRYGWNYVEAGLEAYEAKYKTQSIQRLARAARVFGMTIIPQS